jgi:hypothetical protein
VTETSFDVEDQAEDEIVWTRSPDGIHTAKSAYELQFEGNIISSFRWSVWAPSKCKFFIWLLLQNRVWTTDRLQERGWQNQYFCPFYIRSLKTVCHLFMECPVSCQLWLTIGHWAALQRFAAYRWMQQRSVQDWFYALDGDVSSVKIRGSKSLAILVCWSLWCERNARIFNGKEKGVPRLITEIKDEEALWFSAGTKCLGSIVIVNRSK